ncbi:hypothetical protein NEOC65_000255 [Neochlamydia sp. AcF65]|nr:hypothetical protein [Neochlamydia sp. AcF65]
MIKSLLLPVEPAWKKVNFFFGYVDVISLKGIRKKISMKFKK